MKFLTKVVVFCIIACLLFAGVVIYLDTAGIEVQDSLIEAFYTFFGVELGAAAFIRIAKHTLSIQEIKDKINLIKENNMNVEKKDITDSDDCDDDIYYG